MKEITMTSDEVKFELESNQSADISEAENHNPDSAPSTSSKRKKSPPSLIVSHLPKPINLLEIKEFVEELCGPCEITIEKEESDSTSVRTTFGSEEQLINAKRILNTQCLNGFTIVARVADSDSELEEEKPECKRQRTREDTPWGVDMDVWRTDPKGLYGVKPEYLSSLSINHPLGQWVLVLNFRCGRDELKEVMELAGDVLVCSLQHRPTGRYASVMYSHPLEALQAISMLNGQTLYGRQLTVKLLKSYGTAPLLPKGLNSVGPGLAMYGKPLRDVVRQYERYIKGQETSINLGLFRTPFEQSADEEEDLSEGGSGRKRAYEAIRSLIEEGVELKDILLELKDVIETQNDDSLEKTIDELIKIAAMGNEPEQNTNNASPQDEITAKKASSPLSVTSTQGENVANSQKASPSPKEQVSNGHSSSISNSSLTISTLSPSNPLKRASPSPTNVGGYGGPRHKAPLPTPPSNWGATSTAPIGVRGPPAPMMNSGNFMPSPTNQLYRPNAPRFQQGLGEPMMGGPRFGSCETMSGPNRSMLGQMQMSGQRTRSISSPMPAPMCPMPGRMPGQFGPTPGRPTSNPGLMRGPNFPAREPTTLELSNLPLNMTFARISDRLSQFGQVTSIQFTTPGCVVVEFAVSTHAETCLQVLDKTLVDNNVISVRFI